MTTDTTDATAPAVGAPEVDGGELVLSIRDLNVTFATEDGPVHAVRGMDMDVHAGEILGIVGESGSGKSVTLLAVLGLLPKTATITGSAIFHGQELLGAKRKTLQGIRGAQIGMIFQDPLTALNPVQKIGTQISESLRAHKTMSKEAAHARSIELLDNVGIPQANRRVDQYPHEFSGGMRQRVMIAMAISNDPAMLIADEPTTALDVTIQAQILDLLIEIQKTTKVAIVFITHDLGVIARVARRVQVMYAGRTAEIGTLRDMFHHSQHPYTRGLLASLPARAARSSRLLPIVGSPPSMLLPPAGCAFHPRCSFATDQCHETQPELRSLTLPDHLTACWHAEQFVEPDEQSTGGGHA